MSSTNHYQWGKRSRSFKGIRRIGRCSEWPSNCSPSRGVNLTQKQKYGSKSSKTKTEKEPDPVKEEKAAEPADEPEKIPENTEDSNSEEEIEQGGDTPIPTVVELRAKAQEKRLLQKTKKPSRLCLTT